MPPKKGRGVGVLNYKNVLLINCIEAILPDGAMQWQLVASRYKEVSGEAELRDAHDLKRHFNTNKNLCDNGKKVTGSAAFKPMTARCQAIWLRILAKSSAKNCVGSNSDEEMSESEEESEVNEQYDENAGNEELFDDPPYGSQYNSQQYDETQFEEDNIDNNEVYENVDRPSVSRDFHADSLRYPFYLMLLNHAPFQQLLYLCEQLRHFQRQQMLLHKAHVYPYGIHSHPLLNVMMVDPFTSSAQCHDGHRPPIPPVPNNRGSHEPSPLVRSRDPSPLPAPVPTRSQKNGEWEIKECTQQSSGECRGSSRQLS
jgi:hypothetical protein